MSYATPVPDSGRKVDMTKKLLSLALALFISGLNVLPTYARSSSAGQAEQLSSIKSQVAKLGIGPRAKVKVTLLDGKKLQGYVSEAGADSFTVTEAKTGRGVAVGYSQVKQLKRSGLSTGKKIALGVGIAAAAFTIIIGVVNAALDD